MKKVFLSILLLSSLSLVGGRQRELKLPDTENHIEGVNTVNVKQVKGLNAVQVKELNAVQVKELNAVDVKELNAVDVGELNAADVTTLNIAGPIANISASDKSQAIALMSLLAPQACENDTNDLCKELEQLLCRLKDQSKK